MRGVHPQAVWASSMDAMAIGCGWKHGEDLSNARTGDHRHAAGTHGRHRSRGTGHGASSGRGGRHTQGEA